MEQETENINPRTSQDGSYAANVHPGSVRSCLSIFLFLCIALLKLLSIISSVSLAGRKAFIYHT